MQTGNLNKRQSDFIAELLNLYKLAQKLAMEIPSNYRNYRKWEIPNEDEFTKLVLGAAEIR